MTAVEPEKSAAPDRSGGGWFTPWRFAAVLGLLIVACFPRVVTGSRAFAYLDFGQFAYPVAFYHRECFWQGQMPLWNPLSSCGIPFLAQWNTLTLYPLSLFYLLLPLPWSLGAFCLLHLFLGGMGMYFLANRWTGYRLAAAVAGVAFAFNGLTWYGLVWPHITVALAWMPWVVLAIERAWREGGRMVVVAAVAGAVQMLSGGAEVLVLTWLLLGLLWIVQSVERGASRGKLLWRAVGVGGLAVGLAAVQLFPFVDLLVHSQRGAGYGDPGLGVMPLTGWANYLVPLFHCFRNPQGLFVQPDHWTGSYYVSVSIVGLALLAAWQVRSPRAWVLLALACFGLVMALGDRGLVYAGVRQLAPFVGFMRFPVKFVILPTFALPLLAALGLARLNASSSEDQSREWKRTKLLGLLLLALIALIACLVWKYPAPNEDAGASVRNALTRAVFLVLTVACLARMRGHGNLMLKRFLQTALVLLLWFDVFTHNSDLSPTVPPVVLKPDVTRQFFNWDGQLRAGTSRAMQSKVSYHQMLSAEFRDLALDTSARRLSEFFDFNLLDHVAKLDGFFSVDLKEFAELNHHLYWTTNEAPRLEDFLGVSHTTDPVHNVGWVVRETALPLVTAGQKPIFAESPATMAALMSKEFDPARIVYLPVEAQARLRAREPAAVRLGAPTFSAHRLEVDVAAEAPAIVIVAQTFYHAWHGYVDGGRVPLWRANYAFQALEIPAGKHHVILVYEDKAFLWGGIVSLVALLACGALWAGWRARPG